jgi:hypothetical protein
VLALGGLDAALHVLAARRPSRASNAMTIWAADGPDGFGDYRIGHRTHRADDAGQHEGPFAAGAESPSEGSISPRSIPHTSPVRRRLATPTPDRKREQRYQVVTGTAR